MDSEHSVEALQLSVHLLFDTQVDLAATEDGPAAYSAASEDNKPVSVSGTTLVSLSDSED